MHRNTRKAFRLGNANEDPEESLPLYEMSTEPEPRARRALGKALDMQPAAVHHGMPRRPPEDPDKNCVRKDCAASLPWREPLRSQRLQLRPAR
jgi:hypothetical protein